jgi:hypothetical protein
MQALLHSFKLRRLLASGAISIGLLCIIVYSAIAEPAALQTSQTAPQITGFVFCQPGPLFTGTRVSIQVNVKRNGQRIDNYRWTVGTGEGKIVEGDGTSQIVYEAPENPGSYKINVALEYKGGPPIKGTTEAQVISPTMPPSDAEVVWEGGINLRSGPGIEYQIINYLVKGEKLRIRGRNASNEWILIDSIDNPNKLGWASTWPQYVRIIDLRCFPVINLIPPPMLLAPSNGTIASVPNRLGLAWMSNRPLGSSEGMSEYFQVEIWNKYNEFKEPIDVAWVATTQYAYEQVKLAYHPVYHWRITVIRGVPVKEKPWSTPENRVWEPNNSFTLVSQPSETWELTINPPDTTSPQPTPVPSSDDHHDHHGGGGSVPGG